MHQSPSSSTSGSQLLSFLAGSPQTHLTSHLPLKKRFYRANNPTPYSRFSSPVVSSTVSSNYWPPLLQSYHHHLQEQTPLQLLSTVSALKTVSENFGALNITRGSVSESHISPSAFSCASSSRLSDTSADSGFADEGQNQLQQPLDLSINSTFTSLSLSSNSHHYPSAPITSPQTSPPILSKICPTSTPKVKAPKRLSTLKLPISGSTLSCPECSKGYESTSRFRAHLRRHESKQSGRYRCAVCSKAFVQRSSLKTHERIHTGERPYHCGQCEQRFGDFSTFTKHRRTHTGEKPYQCPHCSKAFSQSGNMHRHRATVHGHEDQIKIEETF